MDRSIPVPVGDLWNPDNCPAALLPWLAWGLSVDEWDSAWSDAEKRAVIKASVEVHRLKGTVWSIRRILAVAGYGAAEIVEAQDMPKLGRTHQLGRAWRLGPSGASWADYWVTVRTPITQHAADRLARLLASVAPARCRLRAITITAAQYVLGRDDWSLGRDVALGSTYKYEVSNG